MGRIDWRFCYWSYDTVDASNIFIFFTITRSTTKWRKLLLHLLLLPAVFHGWYIPIHCGGLWKKIPSRFFPLVDKRGSFLKKKSIVLRARLHWPRHVRLDKPRPIFSLVIVYFCVTIFSDVTSSTAIVVDRIPLERSYKKNRWWKFE